MSGLAKKIFGIDWRCFCCVDTYASLVVDRISPCVNWQGVLVVVFLALWTSCNFLVSSFLNLCCCMWSLCRGVFAHNLVRCQVVFFVDLVRCLVVCGGI